MASATGGKKERCTSNEDNETAEIPVKRARVIQPDTTVIVGGKEFHHFSQILCSVSEYFDAAIHSGMRDGQSKRFEFPDKDPAEWEMLSPLFSGDPFSFMSEAILEENIEKLAEWALFLGMAGLTKLCDDKFFDSAVLPLRYIHGEDAARNNLKRLIACLEKSISLHLPKSKARAIVRIGTIIKRYPKIVDPPIIGDIFSAATDSMDSIKKLWEFLIPFFPEKYKECDPSSLLGNPLFLDTSFPPQFQQQPPFQQQPSFPQQQQQWMQTYQQRQQQPFDGNVPNGNTGQNGTDATDWTTDNGTNNSLSVEK